MQSRHTRTHTQQQQRRHGHSNKEIGRQSPTHTQGCTQRRNIDTQKYRNKDTLTDGLAVDTTMVHRTVHVMCHHYSEKSSDAHLGLSVDIGPVVNQLRDHLLLPSQGCDVQGRVPFLFNHRETRTREHSYNEYLQLQRQVCCSGGVSDLSCCIMTLHGWR